MDWTKISNNPTDEQAVQETIKYLNSIRKPIKNNDYFALLEELLKEQKVLDIGVVEHTIDRIESDNWKHKKICSYAKSCIGVDILEKEAEYLNQKGFNIKVVDATSDTYLGEKFDVIHAGDVIEHIDNLSGLLKFCKRHLKDEGILLVKTPNPHCFDYFFKMFINKTDRSNLEHVCWITPSQALELGRRCGLTLSNYYTTRRMGLKLFSKKGIRRICGHIYCGLRDGDIINRIIHSFMEIFATDEVLSATLVYEYKITKNN